MPEYTKLRQELKDEEFRTWNKTTGDEVKCQDFFLPIQLPGDPGWNRRDGHNTVSYYQGTTEENYQQYHITMSYSQEIPDQLNLHETYPENKGLSEKDSTFIVKNEKLEFDKESLIPTDKIIEVVRKIENYQHNRYKSLILDNRKGKDQAKQTQEIEHEQLFDIDIKKTVNGKSVAESLKSHLVQQFQGIEVSVMLIAKKLDRYRVSIKKENVPSKLIKQQTEIAINQTIEDWAKDNAQSSTPAPEKTTSAVAGPLSRFEDPKLFADDPAPTANPELRVQEANADPKTEEKNDSHPNKLLKQDGGGRGSGGRRPD